MPRHRPQRQAAWTERSNDEARRTEDGAGRRRTVYSTMRAEKGRHGHGRAEDLTELVRTLNVHSVHYEVCTAWQLTMVTLGMQTCSPGHCVRVSRPGMHTGRCAYGPQPPGVL